MQEPCVTLELLWGIVLPRVNEQSPGITEPSHVAPITFTGAPSSSARRLTKPSGQGACCQPPLLTSHPCPPAPSGPAFLKSTRSFYPSLLFRAAP